ncbi:MAG TPA: M50 family metallopeptidase [Blastocatellia bacterium]|nr:M50 family metallopeptidase [Blastocatellia bacterium]
MQNRAEIRDSFNLVMWASGATLALWFIPFAEVIAYPIRLFVTFVHEAGHALAALATLGGVHQIELYLNGSGVTETMGGSRFLISSAGYLGTTVVGAVLLLMLRAARAARGAALGFAIVMLSITLLWGGNLLMWATGLFFGVGFLLLALKGRLRVVHFLMSFLAVQLLLNAFYDLRTLMYLSAFSSHMTDAQNMAAATGGWIPAIFWAVFWAALSGVILAATLLAYYKSLNRRPTLLDTPLPALLTDPSDNLSDRRA